MPQVGERLPAEPPARPERPRPGLITLATDPRRFQVFIVPVDLRDCLIPNVCSLAEPHTVPVRTRRITVDISTLCLPNDWDEA